MEEIRAVVPVSFTASMVSILPAIAAFFKRSPDDLSEERRQYDARMAEVRRLESRNRLAYANSRLNFLQEHGKPFYSPPQAQQEHHQVSRPVMVTEPVYHTDQATGYPFVQGTTTWEHKPRYEQDPLFGWDAGHVFGCPAVPDPVLYGIGFPRPDMIPNSPVGREPNGAFPTEVNLAISALLSYGIVEHARNRRRWRVWAICPRE